MKMADARALMQKQAGYRVHFERREKGMLVSDFFPATDEPTIASLEDAWKLAEQWALVDPLHFVNIYVINALDYAPVDDYRKRQFNRHPPDAIITLSGENQAVNVS